jgi:hypothetical protein
MILTISLFSCKKDSVDIKDTSTQISDVNNDIYTVEEVRTLFDQKKPLDWKTEKDAKFIYSVGVHILILSIPLVINQRILPI